jgi:hypothetical protein
MYEIIRYKYGLLILAYQPHMRFDAGYELRSFQGILDHFEALGSPNFDLVSFTSDTISD